MNIQDLRLSLFQYPRAYISVLRPFQEILRLIQYDNDIFNKTNAFRQKMEEMGKNMANELIKEKLVPAFGVAVTFKGHGHGKSEANGWTGLALCDIDDLYDPVELEATFERLKNDPHALLIFRSISGQGIKVIYWYERENGQRIDDTSWRAAFLMGNEYLSRVANHPYDQQCTDLTRLCGLAHDANLHFNPDAEPFCIADDMIVEQNCEHSLHGKARKEYSAHSFNVSVEETWPFVEKMLKERELIYAPGQHHDFILHAAYLFNRFGVPEDELLAWASQEWSDHNKEERQRAIRHKYKDVDKHGTWKLGQKKKGRENNMVTLPEIRDWLTAHMQVCFNMVTNQLVWRDKVNTVGYLEEIPLTSSEWKPIDKMEINTRRQQIAVDTGKRVLQSDVESVFESDFARKVHPIQQFIERLPYWDGADRVAALASHIHVDETPQLLAERQSYLEWSLHKWLVSMVAMWMDDKVQNQAIFTIIGPQGIYKTTFFRHILPPPLHSYFIENTDNSFAGKDNNLIMAENCLVEIEEVDAIEGKDLAKLKGLVTSEKVKERRPYAKFRETWSRLASFCASGNEQRILTDLTGSRRWLCHLVSSIDNPREWNLDYEQFYAQLHHEYQHGYRYYFDKADEARIEQMNHSFKVTSFEEQIIDTRYRKPKGNETYKLMSASMIILQILSGRVPTTSMIQKIGKLMHQKNYDFIHKKSGEYYKVVEIPYEQQQIYIAMKDEIETNVNTPPQLTDTEQLELPF